VETVSKRIILLIDYGRMQRIGHRSMLLPGAFILQR
jgi:hypothetical protein